MTGEMVAHEARVISDWSGALIHALSQGDRARAAKAAATIAAAARTASFILDPQQAISPAVTSSNGRYITPEGGAAPPRTTSKGPAMTDHLLEAALAALCTDHGEKVDRYDVARAVGYIRDYLEALQSSPEPDPLDEVGMTGRIVRAEFSRGDDGRAGNCSNCTCELHDDALPSGTYITVKLGDGATPGIGSLVTVTEVAS